MPSGRYRPRRMSDLALASGGAAQVLVGDLLDRDVVSCGAQADLAALEHVHDVGEGESPVDVLLDQE